MRCVCHYNPAKDIEAVNPEGWLDLKEAFVNGVVPGDLDFDENDSNGFDDPSQIGDVVRERFQADRARKSMIERANKAKNASVATPAAELAAGDN